MNKTKLNALLVIAATATLVACGGGGGDAPPVNGGNPGTGQPPPGTNEGVSQPQLEVPTPTYAANSEELKVFNALNEERGRCGFGKLAQNDKLDKAAAAHTNYLVLNYVAPSHYETADKPGFTGVYPIDRAVTAGYVKSVNDGKTAETLVGGETGNAMNRLRGLLNAPYHALVLMDGYRDVGISNTAGIVGALVINPGLANPDKNQQFAFKDDDVKTFPCEGTVHIGPVLTGEDPNPVPGRDLRLNPLGVSIQVAVNANRVLKITSATLTNMVTGASVPMREAVGRDNDPHKFYKAHQSYIAADKPMKPETKYQATVNGTSDGKAFSRTFTFTTGTCGESDNCFPMTGDMI